MRKNASQAEKDRLARYWAKQDALITEYKSGGCELCGFNECADALDLHHRNPKDRARNGRRSTVYRRMGLKRIAKELSKCAVLCPTCHRLVHLGLRTVKE